MALKFENKALRALNSNIEIHKSYEIVIPVFDENLFKF